MQSKLGFADSNCSKMPLPHTHHKTSLISHQKCKNLPQYAVEANMATPEILVEVQVSAAAK
jgi:hypothetical protein